MGTAHQCENQQAFLPQNDKLLGKLQLHEGNAPAEHRTSEKAPRMPRIRRYSRNDSHARTIAQQTFLRIDESFLSKLENHKKRNERT
jgi:hypothetical protein